MTNNITQSLAAKAVKLNFDKLTPNAITVAKQCFLDWLGVSIAASQEPLVEILIEERIDIGLAGNSLVVGRNEKLALPASVLVNGAMSHVLDYDDVHKAMRGHPSVPLIPVVLGLGADQGVSGRSAITAFIAGFETQCRIGALCAHDHYARGFHPTATIGALGASVAAGHLLGLDETQMVMSMGIAGTQAAGLKSSFGTYCKALHAGHAAETGLLSARLAKRGFTGAQDILGDPQGFAKTQSSQFSIEAAESIPSGGFYVTRTLFKYHAACFLTHSTIEALNALKKQHQIVISEIESVTVHVQAGHLNICGIEKPQSGLEIKFSLKMMAALALAGIDTSNDNSYTDNLANRIDLIELHDKVKIVTDWSGEGSAAQVEVKRFNQPKVSMQWDVGIPLSDLDSQWTLLIDKFRSLAEPKIGTQQATKLIDICRNLEQENDLAGLLKLTIAID